MIKVKELIVNYKDVRALDKISLTINQGESVALVGRNGAGKSSLLKSLTGIIKPNSGTVSITGNIGWMPEKGYLEDNIKVYEHLEYISYLNGMEKSQIKAEVNRVIELCELSKNVRSYCKDLSKGEMQRIHLASAIINSPDILILDEPSSGFDPLFQKKMIEIIKEVSKDKILIVSTHNIHEIENLTERIVVLREGEISLDTVQDDYSSCRIKFSGKPGLFPKESKRIDDTSFILYGTNYMEIGLNAFKWAENNRVNILDITRSDDWSRFYDYF